MGDVSKLLRAYWDKEMLRRMEVIKMKCTGCGFETEDVIEFTAHLIDCEGKPEEKWLSYLEYGTDSMPFKNSEILEEEK